MVLVKGDKVRLNNELLIWRGFTRSNGVWSYPNGATVDDGVPFFPNDETACFKWLVPKVVRLGYEVRIITAFEGYVAGVLRHNLNDCEVVASDNDTKLALALCLAIKRLIK